MKTISPKHLGIVSLASCCLFSTIGCMVAPGNQQEYASRSSPIEFSGFTVHPNQTVKLYVQNADGKTWTKIGEATSSGTDFVHFDSSWYYWQKEIVVPKSHWRKFGENGAYFVVLKGVADGNDLLSFEEGFYDYAQDYDSLEELYQERKSPHGVNVIVFAHNP